MPIYEYDCPECGKIEVIQKVSDAILVECPNCLEAGKKSKIVKSVSASSFHLKGTGWYKTDYSSSTTKKDSKAKAKTESTPKSEGKPSDEKKTEEKKSESTAKTETNKTETKKCGSGCGCH